VIEKKRMEQQSPPRTVGNRQEILVTILTGVTIKVLYSSDMTVLQLRQAIQAKTGYSLNQMGLLSYNGAPLKDGLRIAQYNIQNRSTIVLTTTTKGG
jgi:hypothetical protein